MENKKENRAFESGKLYGIYRCRKHSELMGKVPRIERPEKPDVADMVIAGIQNYGANPAMIRMMAQYSLGLEDVSIPYNARNTAKRRFIQAVVAGKLSGSLSASTSDLFGTFYSFLDMPTDMTRQLQAESDARDLDRYLQCETRVPVSFDEPVIRLRDIDFLCQQDFLFAGMQQVEAGQHKEGRKYVYDYADRKVVESVRILPGKPQIRQSSSVQDMGPMTRLELYVMLKAAQKWAIEHGYTNALLKASYYYLQKDREDEEHYSPEFFGKGGNVISLQAEFDNIEQIDEVFSPQINAFLGGMSVTPDKCLDCQSKALCRYKGITVPIGEEEKKMPDVLPALSEAQIKAANALDGNIRVVATAGSGKTTAMAYRIVNLLKNDVAPEKIGCFTFTNASAAEMSERIGSYCRLAGIEANLEAMTVSTIHSFGDFLLKKYHNVLGYDRPPVLINEIQRTKIIERILSTNQPIPSLMDKYKNFYLDMFKAKGILELMKDYFAQILNGKSMANFMCDNKVSHETAEAVYSMYMQYSRHKKDACLIEHSDQEYGVLRLLKLKPGLFDEVGIEHISVDEFQDTSDTQFQIINAMRQAKCAKSLFVVGDDDQSIYGFRNANVGLIQNFFSMVGEVGHDIRLMENRRSTANIVRFSDELIAYNEGRLPKNPVSVKGGGAPVSVTGFTSKEAEQEFIVGHVGELVKKGYAGNEIAILAPTNSELLEYAALLETQGIQSVSINPEPLLDNPRVRGAVALVKFMDSNNEFQGMVYAGVRNDGVPKTGEEAEELVKKVQAEATEIHNIQGLFQMFDALDPQQSDEIYQAFLEDIRTAKEAAMRAGRLSEICEYVMDFERFGKKQTARREKAYPGVVLSTMHTAKGKEWPVVFCSVSKLHTRNLASEDIPEKNRVLFVACTRAKEKLYITGVETAFGGGQAKNVQNLFLRECYEAAGEMRLVS